MVSNSKPTVDQSYHCDYSCEVFTYMILYAWLTSNRPGQIMQNHQSEKGHRSLHKGIETEHEPINHPTNQVNQIQPAPFCYILILDSWCLDSILVVRTYWQPTNHPNPTTPRRNAVLQVVVQQQSFCELLRVLHPPRTRPQQRCSNAASNNQLLFQHQSDPW